MSSGNAFRHPRGRIFGLEIYCRKAAFQCSGDCRTHPGLCTTERDWPQKGTKGTIACAFFLCVFVATLSPFPISSAFNKEITTHDPRHFSDCITWYRHS